MAREGRGVKVVGGTPNHLPPTLAAVLAAAGVALFRLGEPLWGALLLAAAAAILWLELRDLARLGEELSAGGLAGEPRGSALDRKK